MITTRERDSLAEPLWDCSGRIIGSSLIVCDEMPAMAVFSLVVVVEKQ
jgi:hypothetical protein